MGIVLYSSIKLYTGTGSRYAPGEGRGESEPGAKIGRPCKMRPSYRVAGVLNATETRNGSAKGLAVVVLVRSLAAPPGGACTGVTKCGTNDGKMTQVPGFGSCNRARAPRGDVGAQRGLKYSGNATANSASLASIRKGARRQQVHRCISSVFSRYSGNQYPAMFTIFSQGKIKRTYYDVEAYSYH